MRVISSWDDGAAEDARLADLLSRYNVEATFYWPYRLAGSVNLSKVRRFLSPKACQILSRSFGVGSHGLTHAFLTRVDEATAWVEISESKEKWEQRVGKPVTSFCYPRGYANQAIRAMVERAAYADARTTVVGSIDGPEDPFATPTTVHVGIARQEYGGKPWLEYALQKLGEARQRPDSVFYLFGHSWEIDLHSQWAGLETLLRELG